VRAIRGRIEQLRFARFVSEPQTGIEALNKLFAGTNFQDRDLDLRCECVESKTRGGCVFCAPVIREVTGERPGCEENSQGNRECECVALA